MVKTVGKYQVGKTLGEGTFGKVKFALNTETNGSVAIKVLDKERIQQQEMGAQVRRPSRSSAREVQPGQAERTRARPNGVSFQREDDRIPPRRLARIASFGLAAERCTCQPSDRPLPPNPLPSLRAPRPRVRAREWKGGEP